MFGRTFPMTIREVRFREARGASRTIKICFDPRGICCCKDSWDPRRLITSTEATAAQSEDTTDSGSRFWLPGVFKWFPIREVAVNCQQLDDGQLHFNICSNVRINRLIHLHHFFSTTQFDLDRILFLVHPSSFYINSSISSGVNWAKLVISIDFMGTVHKTHFEGGDGKTWKRFWKGLEHEKYWGKMLG